MIPSITTSLSSANTVEEEFPRPFWEKALDYTIAIVSLLMLLPIALIAIAVIKCGSPGPTVFKQRRIGHRGQPFMIYKLRTMRLGAETESHERHTLKLMRSNLPLRKMDSEGDSRLVPFGRFLRSSGIDELPQLINVLKGEMSIVGPRPCVPSESAAFSPTDRKRFNTLPGITGLWQVSGKNSLTFAEMIDCDIQYTLRKNLGMYLRIVAKTPTVLIKQILDTKSASAIAKMPSGDQMVEDDRKIAS